MAVASASVGSGEHAGFLIRTGAYIIDWIVTVVIAIVINMILGIVGGGGDMSSASGALNLLISIAYFVYFWSSGGGQTPGMRVLGLRVIKTDGSTLTTAQAFIRWVGLFVSFLAIFIGVIWVAFDKEKQGWHDKIAGTYVVKA